MKEVADNNDYDDRFNSWLSTLEDALKSDTSDSWEISEDDRKALIQQVKDTVDFDSESVPAWAARNERILSSLVSTSDELMLRLRRISFPKISLGFDPLKEELSGDHAAVKFDIGITPLLRERAKEDAILAKYFNSFENCESDAIIGMCKLADFGHRITKISDLDKNFVSKLIRVEESRQSFHQKDIADRSELLTYLEHKDENKLMTSSVSTLSHHLVELKTTLTDALVEEERARQAYEHAVLRARMARENVVKLEGFVDLVATQSEILRKVHELKLKLDGFNSSSAENRIGMLRCMQSYLESLQQRVLKQRIKDEFPVLFQNMTVVFQSMITLPGLSFSAQNEDLLQHLAENPVSAYCAVRIGLETLKLWKKMSTGLIQPLIREQFDDFEAQLQGIKKVLPDWPKDAINSSTQFKNTTVVLHFNHLFHDTPENHVEAPLRTETAIKLLSKKLQQLQRGAKEEGLRDIVLEKCNDILSPPLWCLPLVHAPQYLTTLWRASEEAKAEESFVPLEFDSEWESDLDALVSDEEGMVVTHKRFGRRRKYNQLVSQIDFDAKWKDTLGRDKAEILSRLITPKLGDDDIAATLKPNQAAKPAISTSFPDGTSATVTATTASATPRRKRVVVAHPLGSASEDEQDLDAEVNSPSYKSPKNPATGKRVRTPYGAGTLLEEFSPTDSDDKIIRVKLDWGATGYLAKRIIQRIRRKAKPQTREFSHSGESLVDREVRVVERFVHTNLRIHSVMTRILQQIKIQRLILDKVGVKDAHMSLWLHGRTSRGITKSIESGILCWLSKLDHAKLDQYLVEKEQALDDPLVVETPASGVHFLRELEQVCKSTQGASANEKYYLEEDSESHEQLKATAFEYSKQRLLKKSGEPRSSGIRIKSTKGTPSRTSAVKRIAPPSGADDSISLRQIGRLARLYEPPKDAHLSVIQRKNGEILRSLFFRLSAAMNISQGSFATELSRRFNVKTCQTTISAWMRYKASVISTRLLDQYVLKWVEHHKKLLSEEDQQVLIDLLAARSGSNSRDNDPKSKGTVHATSESMSGGLFNIPSGSATAVEEAMDEEEDGYAEVEEGEGVEEMPDELEEVDNEGEMEEGDNKSETAMSVDSAPAREAAEKEKDDSEDSIQSEPDDNNVPVSLNAVSSKTSEVNESEDVDEEEDEEEEGDGEGEEGEQGGDAEEGAEDEEDFEDSRCEVTALTPILKTLHKNFILESNRRELTHSYIAQEATRLKLRLTQPTLSKFVRECAFPYFARAREFCNHLTRWLEYSSNKGTTVGLDNKGADSSSCSACGNSRNSFDSQREFLEHIGECNSTNDCIPPASLKNLYFPAKAKFKKLQDISAYQTEIEDCEKKLSTGDMKLTEFTNSSSSTTCVACQGADATTACQWCTRKFHAACMPKTGNYLGVTACQLCYQDPVFLARGISSEQLAVLKVGAKFSLFDHSSTTWKQFVVLSFKSNFSVTLLKEVDADNYVWVDLTANRCFIEQDLLLDDDEGAAPVGRKRGRRPSTGANEIPNKKRRLPGRPPNTVRRGRKSQHDVNKELVVTAPRGSRGLPTDAGNDHARFSANKPGRRSNASVEEETATKENVVDGMNDTYLSFNSLKAALCASGIACKAVDIAMTNAGSNVFACVRPPGHHAGRYGCTSGCLSTGFCLLNNAALALMYARVRWGLERIAIVDIDVHFGNGTAEIVKDDDDSFFASVHMIYGTKNDGVADVNGNKEDCACGFYPAKMGRTDISDRYISVGVQPANVESVVKQQKKNAVLQAAAATDEQDEVDRLDVPKSSATPVHALIPNFASSSVVKKEKSAEENKSSSNTNDVSEFVGPQGFVKALRDVIIPKMEAFQPQLLIISAGFDGFITDPLGGEMGLSLDNFTTCTTMLTSAMARVAQKSMDPRAGRVISLLEGGYDTSPESLGLARCVDAHVSALRKMN